uniref:Helicase ssl-1 n=2 Tax=Parascaris univalens TaxID=6257 RepID=A0A915AH61_PARUN
MSTRRSRRRSGAAATSDDPSGSEAPTESSSLASPPSRRRGREGASLRTLRSSDIAKNELASRILQQLKDLRIDFYRKSQASGADITELEFFDGVTKDGDAKNERQLLATLLCCSTPKHGQNEASASANLSPRVNCDASKLLPIEVKVEDVVPDSPSVSYSEQQPSTSSAVTASQSGVSLSGIPSQATSTLRSSIAAGTESNVERAAKQEAQVLARVAELRRQGLWTASRLPMIEMPSRNKTQWDYLLEEMRWMAADFRQERTFKRHAARKFATQIARLQRDKEQEEERAQQRAVKEAKRVCALIAKMVRDFWQNVDKVVDYRAQEIIESMKRKALDQQLELMVGQADKLSEMVQEGLTEKVSKAPSDAGDEDSNREDEDFAYMESESDDETTIAKAEATIETNVEEEMRDLERENNLELDDLLASLPPGYLESMGLSKPGTSKEGVANERSGGETSEEVSDEDEQEDNDATKEEDDSDDEPLVKKRKKPIDRVVEERSPAQSDSIGRSGSSASMKESEESSILPSEEVSKDMSEGINFARLTSESSEDRQKELANIAEEALKFQPKGFTLETTQVKTDVPSLIRGTLREYQLVGLDWLVTLYDKGLNGILADEMGLGKTIQTIALLAHLACKEANWGPHLIVVPTSVILNWEMELKKWCPAFKILTYFGSQKERAEKRKGWSKPNMFHVCVTSYKIVTQDIRSFKHKAWQYFILDEAQNIKNFKSQRWQTLLNIRARRRLLLTGTPLQNSLMELWSLMHFLMPAIFASHNDFKDWFSNPLTGMMEGSVEWNAPLVQRLHKVLRPFILRRLKVEVEKQLPEKTEHIVKCPLSKRQRYLYDDFMSLRSTRENLRSGSVMSVLNIVMQLRKCCNHPNLFEPRPVVSPFAMQPISLVIPAIIFDICNSECENDGLPSIPDCLRLDNVIRGSHFAHSEMRRLCVKKALIEELSQQETGSAMPKVEGFKFVRPPPPPKQMKHPDVQGGQLSTNVAAVSVPAGSLPQSGEYYVCVDNGTARVYQLVTTSSGERTIRECDPTAVAGSAATATPIMAAVEVPALPIQVASPPLISVVAQPVATQPGVEVKTEVKTESIVEVVGAPSEQRAPASTESEKPADRRAVFRTRTIMNKAIIRTGQALKQELTAVNNGCTSIHEGRQVMIPVGSTIPYQTAASTESPTRSRCVAQVRPLTASGLPLHIPITNGVATHRSSSPPLKRRRLIAPKIDRQPYAELILPETHLAQKERRQACVQRIAEMCARRIEWPNSRRAPLVSDELLSILIDEVKKKHRRKPRSEHGRAQCVELNAFECWEDLGWIHDRLRLLVEDMVDRFTVFVHGAIADAPKLEPTSVGRVAYRKQLAQERADICRRIFELDDPLVAKCRMMQMLQFPELRLIEYDCGKLQVLSSLLRDLFLYKHRCLIFTQMSRMLDVLQAFLSFHGYQYFRLDGTTGIEQRQAMMERFNSDPKIFCFILSTRSGGIGVNLTGADTVIFYDSDWNPTMDAQAQDRCHRIGQTRNVTIYRLISERTIEENILKKAMQKRRLGELAIDEGGFTPEFFKGDNLRELFQGEAAVADVVVPVTVSDVAELEKAMAKLEDVQDVAAAKRANAEAKAELAEFDESVLPNGDNSSNTIDRADSKYFELISQLKPIERYAINFLEAEYKPDFEEEVKEAEAMIASKKDEWLKAHETVMEGEPNEGDDEFDLTYSNGFGVAGSVDEIICLEYPDERMPIWTPLSPPASDADDDLYYDACGDFWYEREPMSESRLPATIHELHRPRPPAPTPIPASISLSTPLAAAALPFLPSPSSLHSSTSTPRQRVQPSVVESILPATPSSAMLSAAISLDAPIPQPSIVSTPVMAEIRASSLLVASTSSGSQERERVNTVPQTGVTSGAPYLDTSNLLRPATPSRIPNSVDDAIDSVRKSAQKSSSFANIPRSYGGSSRSLFSDGRGTKGDMRRPLTPPPREWEAVDYEGPEWNVVEDYALLLAVAQEQHLPYHLHSSKPGHIVNWDFASQLMTRSTCFYRSPRQCSIHYQLVIQPREEGRMMTLDPVTKKSRKVPVSSVELMHMKRGRTTTEQQYNADALKLRTSSFIQKVRAAKAVTCSRRSPILRKSAGPRKIVSLSGRLPAGQEMKLCEFGIRYENVLLCTDLVEYREERRAKLHEQDKERQRIKEEEERQKEIMFSEQQSERDQKVQKRESAVMALPGIITYQRTSMGSMLELSQQQQHQQITSVPVSGVSSAMGAAPLTTVRTIGSNLQQSAVTVGNVPTQGVAAVVDSAQAIAGQRALSDHQQMASLPSVASGVHHSNPRRVQIPTASGMQTQHQIVMTGGAQLGQATTQQPYTVVVSSQDNILTGGTSQVGTRIQYTTRQEGPSDRQTIYRAIAPTGTKRTPPATPVQRVGLPMAYASSSSGQPTQIYSTTSHGGRALIVSQASESQTLGDQPQLQMMRPQLQPVGAQGLRQDVRPKITQRTQNRVYLTTSGGERTYLMPQSQVRMLPSGQRITQKRTTGTLQGKTLGGQQQVTMMVPSRGGGIQQVRAVPRNIASGYQSSRMPSIGLIMSGGSGARNNETIGGSGTTRQLPPPGSQIISTGGLTHSRQLISTSSSQGPISRQLAAITAQNAASSASASSANTQSTMTTTFVRTIPASTSVITQDHYTGPVSQQTQSLPPISLSTQSVPSQPQQRLATVTPRQMTSQSTGATSPSPLSQAPTPTGNGGGGSSGAPTPSAQSSDHT